MKLLRKFAWLIAGAILASGVFIVALGNDSAASRAIGGIQLRREANISMEKELLSISQEKVKVEYEFLNDTDRDITTEVAFPIPPYQYDDTDAGGPRGFDDFRLWVEGNELKYEVDARAKLNNKDYSDLLTKYGLDIASHAHYDTEIVGRKAIIKGEIAKLSARQRHELSRIGLLAEEDTSFPNEPLWDVLKTYYWTQTFPAHKVLHIRHEYTPSKGFELVSPDDLDLKKPDRNHVRDEIENACVDPLLRKGLMDRATRNHDSELIGAAWVDYILTTANSWKTPIKDFTLIIGRAGGGREYVSLCWDGPIKNLDADHFVTRATNFVPKKELHVVFFTSVK